MLGPWSKEFGHEHDKKPSEYFFAEERADAPLALYVHLRFRAELCCYCNRGWVHGFFQEAAVQDYQTVALEAESRAPRS